MGINVRVALSLVALACAAMFSCFVSWAEVPVENIYLGSENLSVQEFCEKPGAAGSSVCVHKEACIAASFDVGLCLTRYPEASRVIGLGVGKTLGEWIAYIISASLLALTAKFKLGINRLTKTYVDPIFNAEIEKVKTDNFGVNVVLVGLGGTGKTSIIRALTGVGAANPRVPTVKFNVYSVVNEIDATVEDEHIRRRLRMYIEDYSGQIQQDRITDGRLTERENIIPCTILVFVVDLFSTPKPNVSYPVEHSWDQERVDQNIDYYTPDMAAQKSLSENFKHVVFFINKCDLIRPYTKKTDQDIIDAYQPLLDSIYGSFVDKSPDIIVGAASQGKGVTGWSDRDPDSLTLLEILTQYAKKLRS